MAGGEGEEVGGRRRAREGGVASAMAQKGQDGWAAGSMASLVVVDDEGIGGVEARVGRGAGGWALGVEKSLYVWTSGSVGRRSGSASFHCWIASDTLYEHVIHVVVRRQDYSNYDSHRPVGLHH